MNLEIIKKLDQILALKDGWGKDIQGNAIGKAITKEARDNFKLFLELIRKFNRVYLFPRLEGGLQIESSFGEIHFNCDGSIHLVFDRDNKIKQYEIKITEILDR